MQVKCRFWAGLPIFFMSACFVLAQPSITSVTPAYGSYADPNYVVIAGSGFYPGTLVVKFNGVTDTTAAPGSVAGTNILARVPTNAPFGSGHVFVSVNGSSVLSPQNFTVVGIGPYVDHFTPTTGGGGLAVTLVGTHFTGVTSVTFNGKPAASINIQNDNQIVATTPNGVTSGPLVIVSPKGTYNTATNATTTNFYAPSVIKGFSPSSGRAGTNVIITGTNLLGTSSITIGSTAVTSFTVLSNNAVQLTIPTNATSGVFFLVSPAGGATVSSNFVILPTIYGFSPTFGPVGTSVVITGANLNVGTPTVKFNGVAANPPTGVSFGQLTAVVPSTTSGPITVMTSDGTATSASNFNLPASITSFTPTNGAAGTSVKIMGVNFTNASAVSFNGTPATSFVVTNNTTIGAIAPVGVSTGPITVTTPAGSTNTTGLFYAPPGITSFTPTHGFPGTNVVLTGSNFLGATSVRFGGLNAAFLTPINNTTLVAIVPNNATNGPISVVTPGGSFTSAIPFTLDYSNDVAVLVTNTPNPVFVGSNIVYSITVVNYSSIDAPNVRITNTLPTSVIPGASTTTQGTLSTNGNIISGNLGTIPPNTQVFVVLNVIPQATGLITDTVTVSSDYPDPVPGNNSQSVDTFVLPLPRLSITKLISRVQLSWPQVLTNYNLQFANTLGNSVTWSNMTNIPLILDATNYVTDPTTNTARFYRLKK